jgi:hypothetical protein
VEGKERDEGLASILHCFIVITRVLLVFQFFALDNAEEVHAAAAHDVATSSKRDVRRVRHPFVPGTMNCVHATR